MFSFNEKFKMNKLNAIYKSFYSDDIVNSINAVKNSIYLVLQLACHSKKKL